MGNAIVACFVAAMSIPTINAQTIEAFQDSVSGEFRTLLDAAISYADHQSGLSKPEEGESLPDNKISPVILAFGQAEESFLLAVIEHWPYPQDTREGPALAPPNVPPGFPNVRQRPLSEAQSALKQARQFEQNEYLKGHADREQAVRKYLDVADRFPGTLEHDKALCMGAKLYTERLAGGAKRDSRAAYKLYSQLVSRPGPPTPFYLLAEENVASYDRNDTARMKDRSNLCLSFDKRSSLDWLRKNLLVPSPDITPEDFARNVVSVLITLRAARITNTKNMVADAALSESPLQNLKWLKERHPNDSLVQREIQVAMERVLRKHLGIDENKLDSIALAEITDDLNRANVPLGPAQFRSEPRTPSPPNKPATEASNHPTQPPSAVPNTIRNTRRVAGVIALTTAVGGVALLLTLAKKRRGSRT